MGLAAVWSVNKGRCRANLSAPTLEKILSTCDKHRIFLVLLWVPREENEVADYLSHLSYVMNRKEVRGRTRGV